MTTPHDPQAFRQALGAFTTGVTIITTRDAQGMPVGLTANSFNSVSLDPPLVLWSLAKSARSRPAFEAAAHWAVHILAADQEALSNRFARSGEDKFSGVAVAPGVGGVPLLQGCAARLECRTGFRYEGGDHIIFVGEVLAFERSAAAPLVFHGGSYAIATPKPAAGAATAGEGTSFGEDFLGFVLSRAHFDIYARVREVHEAKGLGDAEFFLLVCLLGRDGQTLEEVNGLFRQTGHQITPVHVGQLVERRLLQAPQSMQEPLGLTSAGRSVTLHMLAAIKSIESNLLDQLGNWEALSLKTLLKKLVRITDIGLPDPWARSEHAAPRASTAAPP